jgi:putative ABC transport system permease protein
MAMLTLAAKSLYNRRSTAILTIVAIAVSVCLLLGVERIRTQAKESFANTITGTDLIVGARGGSIQLLLYSVFRIGDASNNISWQSYQAIASQPQVKWSVPLSLGDSHRGYRVLGTSTAYFEHYRYGQSQLLSFENGQVFEGLFDAVIGAEVASKLGYKLGDKIIIAHGSGVTSFSKHEQMPFTISGILKRTATPVDSTVHVSLAAIEAIHQGWNQGIALPGAKPVNPQASKDLQAQTISAALIGLDSRVKVFQLQRYINQYPSEALQAIIPGVALHKLWNMMSIAEQALLVIAAFVVVSGLLGMLTMILASLNERRREMAILRAIGARPWQIFLLMISEAGILALLGTLLGLFSLFVSLWLAQPWLQEHYGIFIRISALSVHEWQLLILVLLSGLTIGAIPSIRAYRMSLADGMSIRI